VSFVAEMISIFTYCGFPIHRITILALIKFNINDNILLLFGHRFLGPYLENGVEILDM